MDWQRVERCLAQVDAYKASRQKAKVWAQDNGVALRELASWCAHANRWRARMDGAGDSDAAPAAPIGFVAARVAKDKPLMAVRDSVRIELQAGATAVALQWPTTHPRELAAWLRELSR
jgi:hypothetical protein